MGIALLSAVLLVPLGAEPHEIPVPRVDRREQAWRDRNETQLARQAYSMELPFEVRVVGERLRRFGRADARGDLAQAGREREELLHAVVVARELHGDHSLLVLRAVQTQLFMDALRRWEAGGDNGEALADLAGDFVATARANRWLEGRQVVLTRQERRTLFQVRWARLTGLLDQPPFAPTLNEWRAYYRFLIEHPELGRLEGDARVTQLVSSYIGGVVQFDPEYPALLALGMVRYQDGQFAEAVRLFQRYLDEEPDGPRRAWARNFLLAAARKSRVARSADGP